MSIILWPRKWVHFLTENTSTAKCNREFADGGHAVANCGVERNILCQRSLTSPGEWMCSPDSTMDLSGLPRRHLGVGNLRTAAFRGWRWRGFRNVAKFKTSGKKRPLICFHFMASVLGPCYCNHYEQAPNRDRLLVRFLRPVLSPLGHISVKVSGGLTEHFPLQKWKPPMTLPHTPPTRSRGQPRLPRHRAGGLQQRVKSDTGIRT